jgi:hypothetical protein
MAKRADKKQKSQTNTSELVVVAFTQDIDQAREYEILLQNNDIPATLKKQKDRPDSADGIAVLVPEECLDEALVCIESQGAFDDFYDFALEDEEDENQADYDDDLLDDNF